MYDHLSLAGNLTMVERLFALLLLTSLSACSTITPFKVHPNKAIHDAPKFIGVFFDGTNNDESSSTNVTKLHHLATLQNRTDVHTMYVTGVGVEGIVFSKLFGLVAGYGIDTDVQQAYLHLGNVYKDDDDKILIFGFSRGAYAARVLAGLIDVAGIPDFSAIDSIEASESVRHQIKTELVKRIFDSYVSKETLDSRRTAIISSTGGNQRFKDADIDFLGLWDTVPAIGTPTYIKDVSDHTKKRPSRYRDQLCNVKKAAHAMSIDDNRARVFVALTLTYDDLIKDCPGKDIEHVVDEVWFSGAHSDVGGGNNTDLSGVSLNWMIEKVMVAVPGFLPAKASVYQNYKGESNISSEWPHIPFGNRNRHFMSYARQSSYNGGIPKVHKSVIQRIAVVPKKTLEFAWAADLNNNPLNPEGPETRCIDRVRISGEEDGSDRDSDHIHLLAHGQKCFDVVE